VWWVVSAILLVAFLQRVHGGRATAAVLVFPGVLTLLMVGGYFGWVYYIMAVGLPGTMGTMGAAAGAAEVQIMVTELRQNASQDDAPWPGHASQLVTDGGFGIDNFVLMETSTTTDDIPVAATTLAGLVMQTPNRQTLATQAAADALPDDVVAHRVGDFVFTYHGLDLLGGDPGLWIVLSSPDPDAGPHPNAGGLTTVGLLDGSVVTYFDAVEFATALQDQNALRLDNGVQGLPDPSTVTHGTPAR
jgi:hypothetical protein